ncbi:BREX-1 system adenine-specific DNA-methyltransferase PglX [Desulfogranum mediterraneum]|uniref:BREX-1 system adenine-specific DNA-methyltransferase PglX n=1 Tax=Desulfogranum mediterraneum TaxID=160661 RepID=UPI00040F7940|nr:BREX-1 system adenine-specific DNA-methyltransferase PglX [Desulfogranum mediterraneum]
METAKLKKFAQFARRNLMEQVAAKLNMVLAEGSAARREKSEAIKRLDEAIGQHSQEQVTEQVAYIWFNRFCALRFMDVNRYTRIGVVSPAAGQFQPEILAEAKMGYVAEEMVDEKIRQQVFALLDGQAPSSDPQGEAYRLLVVGACNYWHRAMPFLFQRIDDYTELLMPDDLLSGNSILAYTREAMTPDTCRDVEVIGWLYQFYIAEKKDEVFAGLKKNRKVTPKNIPAATQLFTPHYIVRYLVENSLGRLWMLNRPGSKLVEQMDYYIRPEQPEADFLRISTPEEIKICDPACGSGHMLTYAFNLLHAIYEEEGYEPAEIPEKILRHNLYGIEIDERAGEMAAFALTMKARAKQRRFFRKKVVPNICVLENVHFDENELKNYMDFVGRNLFTAPLQTTLRQFEEADNFGSLIRPKVTDVAGMLKILASKNVSGQLFLSLTHQKVLQALQQADYLSPKYHVVVANPPYMGSKGMNGRLKKFAQDKYKISKPDLFAMFIERNLNFVQKQGVIAMITMQSWMFLSSFEALRARIMAQNTLLSMAHLGARAFDSIGGEVVSTTAFVLENTNRPEYRGGYLRLVSGNSEAEKEGAIREVIKNKEVRWYHKASAADFRKISGTPIAYWVPARLLALFDLPLLKEIAISEGINKTTDNDRFIRYIWEVGARVVGRGERWLLLSKGGDFRKWYGNIENVIDWSDEAIAFYKSNHNARLTPKYLWYEKGVTWTRISSGIPCFRLLPSDVTYETAGATVMFEKEARLYTSLSFLNTNIACFIFSLLNPTLTLNTENIRAFPDLGKKVDEEQVRRIIDKLLRYSKSDWDICELSWGFSKFPLLQSDYSQPTLKATYHKLRAYWQKVALEMQRLEEKNNNIFIEAYVLQGDFGEHAKPPLNEITLTCNPHHRYGNSKSEEELEALLLADTMREFISYSVGCMFGRYALEKPGLILANQGETMEDYLKQISEPSFPADDDSVIPMLEGDWFPDDIVERFRTFLRITFGEEHYEENLTFIENALNIKNKKNYTIRNYFLSEFYTDHVKRYKKRPIYWMFSSPKGSFNALIYMHRYRPDTVSVVLNAYLREFQTKLISHKQQLESIGISTNSSQREKTKALRDIERVNKVIAELNGYENETLYPLATRQIEIDLDDGVKHNYPLFGKALKKIAGLSK